jgi:hypothetical protein
VEAIINTACIDAIILPVVVMEFRYAGSNAVPIDRKSINPLYVYNFLVYFLKA